MAGPGMYIRLGVNTNPSQVVTLYGTTTNTTTTSTTTTTTTVVVSQIAHSGQLTKMGEPAADNTGANIGQSNEVGQVLGEAEGSVAGSQDQEATGANDGVVFERFNAFPLEIRSMIWKHAAEAVKPRGVYQFTYKLLAMGPGGEYPHLSRSMFSVIGKIDDGHPLARNVHELVMWSYPGDCIMTFTPSATVTDMTRGARDLLRSCSEARDELTRGQTRAGSCLNFHYIRDGKVDLGTMRPFCFDTDWICIDGLPHPDAPGNAHASDLLTARCFADLGRIQHLAFHYTDGPMPKFVLHDPTVLDLFRRLGGLKSVGFYQPSFCMRDAAHWDRITRQTDRLFLKGVPTPASGPAQGIRLSRVSYLRAFKNLGGLVWRLGNVAQVKKFRRWDAGSCDIAGLKVCLLIHSTTQEGLDIMKFKEDGSHLDGLGLDRMGDMGTKLRSMQLVANSP